MVDGHSYAVEEDLVAFHIQALARPYKAVLVDAYAVACLGAYSLVEALSLEVHTSCEVKVLLCTVAAAAYAAVADVVELDVSSSPSRSTPHRLLPTSSPFRPAPLF